MNEQTEIRGSYSIKEVFLMEFTRELIRHSGKGEMIQLKKIIEEETKKQGLSKEIPKKISKKVIKEKKKILEELPEPPPISKLPEPPSPSLGMPEPPTPQITITPKRRMTPLALRIPDPSLPSRFRYLRPYPTTREIDLGKLNPLIKDPLVEIIECNSPYQRVIVIGGMGRKETNIVLGQTEMDETIRKFSEISKIPVHIGIYRVVIGRLILLAIVSEVVNSRFIIKKMPYFARYNQGAQGYPNPSSMGGPQISPMPLMSQAHQRFPQLPPR